MHQLTHFRLCPLSRSVRLALAELNVAVVLAEERPWEPSDTLMSRNPAGELPVLVRSNGEVICGAYPIAEFLDETGRDGAGEGRAPFALFPGDAMDRSEVRRIVDWFQRRFNSAVSDVLLTEKIYARLMPEGGSAPDPAVLRAARAEIRRHMGYVNQLAEQRRWLAGETVSFGDLAAAAQFSTIDYLGEAPWQEFPEARMWYARIKSRPSFRSLLTDRMPGVAPPAHYADLDF